MYKTLVILAAGIGSRFGGGIKQLTTVGPNNEIIIDYSVHDAIKAGFNRIIFIIRKDIEIEFKEVIGNRIEKICERCGVKVDYAYQELTDIPGRPFANRTKPWGTGHAVLACRNMIHEPFAVINADDYYGKEGFAKAIHLLDKNEYGMIAYVLKNTLSENGGVTRGICTVDNGKLVGIDETKNIVKTSDGAKTGDRKLDPNALVSMNFLCFKNEFMEELKTRFPLFLQELQDEQKDEFLLPVILDGLIKEGTNVEVISTDDKWFGITYQEDKQPVIQSFGQMYEKSIYDSKDLYSDLK